MESQGKCNLALPNRLEPFRDFVAVLHDQSAMIQVLPGFWGNLVFGKMLAPTRDAFMINYASDGMGAEVITNRLGVGPMHDCLSCSYEEFFLSAHTTGDIGMLVDVPANVGLQQVGPGSRRTWPFIPLNRSASAIATWALR